VREPQGPFTEVRSRCFRKPGTFVSRINVTAPPPGELLSELHDNSAAILLIYGTARVLLTVDTGVSVFGSGELTLPDPSRSAPP
jgi:hypothetical protein